MKRLFYTLISFTFFFLLGGVLALAAPRLIEPWLPATALSTGTEARSEVGYTEITAPALATPRQSDSPAHPGPGVTSHQLTFGGEERQWWGFDGSIEGKPAPVVLLLHGSGRSGHDMLAAWQEIARSEGLVLVAPDAANSQTWSTTQDGADFLNAVLASAAGVYPVDSERVYLFGHSAGANFALNLSAQPPHGVRAVATHAGAVSPAEADGSSLPLRLYIGDNDHLLPLSRVREAAGALARAGHPTELVVIPGHDHWFYDAAPAIAADAWAWFAAN